MDWNASHSRVRLVCRRGLREHSLISKYACAHIRSAWAVRLMYGAWMRECWAETWRWVNANMPWRPQSFKTISHVSYCLLFLSLLPHPVSICLLHTFFPLLSYTLFSSSHIFCSLIWSCILLFHLICHKLFFSYLRQSLISFSLTYSFQLCSIVSFCLCLRAQSWCSVPCRIACKEHCKFSFVLL